MNGQTTPADNGKTAAIVSYLSLIGWLISYLAMYKDHKTSLAAYHLRQTLLLMIIAVAFEIFISVAWMFLPWMIMSLFSFLWIGFLVLWIIGLIAAVNGEEKPMPLIGKKAQELFKGI